ncbi:hypothetical protein U91I_00448 [alpha proteobacterium U9-1i]|nr:hypothetical protein U91I_00448 [alpha proteobacterium U9-1i]
MTRDAYTLTETLVVLAIFGLIAALVAAGAPSMASRAQSQSAAARLAADLTLAPIEARRLGAFGALVSTNGGKRYQVRLNEALLIDRDLPYGVRIDLAPEPISIDAAGRWQGETIELESPDGRILFIIDDVTGVATRQSNGIDGNTHRSSDLSGDIDRLLVGSQRRARRPGKSKKSGLRRRTRQRNLAHRNNSVAEHPSFGPARRLGMAPLVRPKCYAKSSPGARKMRGPRFFAANASNGIHHNERRRARAIAPAMSLLELLVALAVLGLVSALVFSNVGGNIEQARSRSEDAQFWRAIDPAQILLAELASGSIEPRTRSISATEAAFDAIVPRLSVTPLRVRLGIAQHGQSATLRFYAGDRNSLVLHARGALRFAQTDHMLLVLEHRRRAGETWTPIAVGRFLTNAPFQCSFDPIPRTCR